MKKIILAFLIWRYFLFIIAGIAPFFIDFKARFPYYQERLITTDLPHFIWSFGNFDGVHYLGIAQSGYTAQFTQAFFPMYPVLVKLFSYPLSNNLFYSGLIVSNVAFLLALIVLYKLTEKIFNESIAFWSCLFLLAFPTSFYFGSIYTESLFLLMILLSFYLQLQGKILLSSIVGSFSSITRLVGIFLAPALALKNRKSFSVLPFLIVPLGLISYIAYLQFKFNRPLYFLTSQIVFGQDRTTNEIILLPQVFFRYLKILLTTKGLVFSTSLFELLTTIFTLTVLVLSLKKKIPTAWLVFSFSAVLLPTLTGTLASMPRYILIAFPIYIYLGQIKNSKIKLFLLTLFFSLLTITTALFTQGYWVA